MDYGSFVRVPDDSGAFKEMFAGLSKDLSKLPISGIPTFTKAYCIDTATVYIFEATTARWYEQ